MPLLTLFTLFTLFPLALSAQDADSTQEAGFFPIALFLEAAEYAEYGCWQPDWPLSIPVDAFTAAADNWLSIVVSIGEDQYSLRRSPEGLILEFPFLFQGDLAQVKLEYGDDENQISKAQLFPPGTEDPIAELDILEYRYGYPYMIRVRQDSLYSFVLLGRRQQGITEAWFDRDGQLWAVYEHRLIRVFDRSAPARMKIDLSELRSRDDYSMSSRSFDSRFLITGISGSEGEFSLSYSGEKYPRYLVRKMADVSSADMPAADDASVAGQGGRYSYQWDMNGFLVRFYGVTDGEDEENSLVDSRYEYTLDDMGNWTERQETVMKSHFGYLAAEGGLLISRSLEYVEAAPDDDESTETAGLPNE